MSNEMRLERVSKRTYRLRGPRRIAQDPAKRATRLESRDFTVANLSRFATGAQKAQTERAAGS